MTGDLNSETSDTREISTSASAASSQAAAASGKIDTNTKKIWYLPF